MKCDWTKRAQKEYRNVVKYIAEEFGKKAASNFIDDVEYCDDRIYNHPEIGFPEPLLSNRKKYIYRSCIISKYNKVVYTIKKQDKVTIIDMWDMRREPSYLSSRIKTK